MARNIVHHRDFRAGKTNSFQHVSARIHLARRSSGLVILGDDPRVIRLVNRVDEVELGQSARKGGENDGGFVDTIAIRIAYAIYGGVCACACTYACVLRTCVRANAVVAVCARNGVTLAGERRTVVEGLRRGAETREGGGGELGGCW